MAATRPSHHSRATSPPCTGARAVTNNERRSARWHPRADLAPRPMAPRSCTRLWATHVRGSFGHGDGGDERVELHHVRDHPPVRSVTRAGKGQRGYYSRESNEGTHCRESRFAAVRGGARAHMSQQHEMVSQMSRFVSLKSARAEPMFPSAQESRRLYAIAACSGEVDALASVRLVGSAGRDEEAQQVGGHANPEVHHRAIEDCARHCTPARGDACRTLSGDAHGPEKFVVPEGVGAHTRTRLTAAQADGGTRIPPRRDRGGAAAHLLRKAAEAQQTGVGVMTCQEARLVQSLPTADGGLRLWAARPTLCATGSVGRGCCSYCSSSSRRRLAGPRARQQE